jgi:hypothetical protein
MKAGISLGTECRAVRARTPVHGVEALSRSELHLNRSQEASVWLGNEPKLETSALLLPAANLDISSIRRLPAAIRTTGRH